ncbi:hypothetical protein AbraIFM66951_008312, partial [Aspergillus brasiliensis]
MTTLRDSSCTVFPQSEDVLTSAGIKLTEQDKRTTNCTIFPTSDDLILSSTHRDTVNHTTQYQVTRQILGSTSVENQSPTQVLGRVPSNGKRPAEPEAAVRDAKRLSNFVKDGSPWTKYRRFIKLGSSGKCFLGTDAHERSPRIIAVKELTLADPKSKQNLIGINHPNIVQLHEAWLQKNI